ncbi:MAG: SAM-dependent methyltransferase [Microgenomates group bacterium GW2011_GWC1_44_37]|uniref:SAM-dependent methyltransferase n=1 Tax=Candidatus Collierbacteria bacterium GW2011_GWB2_44_22 TaxID=1618387 RepID=A0A0G1K6E5_9BACT|nr:MAG: SAM-dependent methyltransferase [Candidatus Collierbacteria bacterium GW2011_GWA2_44_13]KKT50190.1 MAG: SAM-dependent methyltransferase [Candidatus Collierbacteria bacterium GW2011_GWB1_44_197]KKT51902.1 MAG: SAM-dependent methyltransferase [Candidatus Collierbacteria bacterium GW2011_GWB2_44_22]KKT61886.1 MAG: SAM-dependent methyltransferase [Candidatus Collierbacteria bacterium GW2011_GWD1_44_27]KKT66174.1 MAG: SAM-dependent methyltransferase [Candidatus Collierbacteria bacterium GW20
MDWKEKLTISPLYDWFGKRSYAQSGEDLIACGELGGDRSQKRRGGKGFYVDVGAYHPKLFSNTYLFYKKGWRGICVDPNPQMEELYRKARPRDVFVNMGVGGVKENKNSRNQELKTIKGESQRTKEEGRVMEYFMFEDGAANTFSPEQAIINQKVGRKLLGKQMVPLVPLKKILDKYLPRGQKIDLLSVDVEGMDLEVLKSNDWKKYRPRLVICEDLEFDLREWKKSKVVECLDSLGYMLKAITPYSLIFLLNE